MAPRLTMGHLLPSRGLDGFYRDMEMRVVGLCQNNPRERWLHRMARAAAQAGDVSSRFRTVRAIFVIAARQAAILGSTALLRAHRAAKLLNLVRVVRIAVFDAPQNRIEEPAV